MFNCQSLSIKANKIYYQITVVFRTFILINSLNLYYKFNYSKKMAKCKIVFLLFGLAAFSVASPAKPSFWKGTPLDTAVESMRSDCANNDEIACMKYKVMSLLDTVFKKDSYQVIKIL